MHILLTGGGTAGHVNPAIAIAETFKERMPDTQISFVGTPNGMENKLVASAGFPMYHVKSRGFARSFPEIISPKNFYAAYLMLTSPIKARKLLRELRPDVVIGTGGYVCYPVLKAAALEGIPCAVHESNAIPGMAVNRLKHLVHKVYVNFEETSAYFPEGKATTVGNPLRRKFLSSDRRAVRASLGLSDSDLLILSFGGSLGADALNNACLTLMKEYVQKKQNVHMIHGCGERNYAACLEKYRRFMPEDHPRIELRAYIENMPELMQAADVIISRAGAMTVSEIALAGCASVLIPSPNVANNHQLKNARLLSDADAAILLEESDDLGNALVKKVSSLLESSHKRRTMAEKVRPYARANAADIIYNEILKLADHTL